MRVLSLAELSRCTRSELSVLLHRIASETAEPARRLARASQRAHEPVEHPQGVSEAGLPAALSI